MNKIFEFFVFLIFPDALGNKPASFAAMHRFSEVLGQLPRQFYNQSFDVSFFYLHKFLVAELITLEYYFKVYLSRYTVDKLNKKQKNRLLSGFLGLNHYYDSLTHFSASSREAKKFISSLCEKCSASRAEICAVLLPPTKAILFICGFCIRPA